MTAPDTRQLRLLLSLAVALAAIGLLWLLLGATRSALELWRELAGLPLYLRLGLAAAALLFIGFSARLVWRLLHPRPRAPRPVPPADRPDIEKRLLQLQERRAETARFESELEELDRRARQDECYVAVFGEISAGKSSLIRALAPQADAAVDVLGGTTVQVSHHRGQLGARELILADVPGTQEAGAREREQIARDEALRAHAVIYVASGDLTRAQDAELRWLHGYGKPLLLALNKIDQLAGAEREALAAVLQRRYADSVARVVGVRAGGSEQFLRRLPDGREEQVTRQAAPQVEPLRQALAEVLSAGAQQLEPARAAAVLGHLDTQVSAAEQAMRERESRRIVERHTRRAIVGALAAVAPGTDLLIQGALATALVRELAELHQVPVSQIDLDAFLRQAALTLRTTSSVVLAIAGNALKAFPGLGTLGGGIVHAIAYGLIFDSLGQAVSRTLLEQHRFDREQAQAALQALLGQKTRERLGHVAELTLRAASERVNSAE